MAETTADVAVVGGGLMGASVAYTLRKRGISVALIERNSCTGRETTARSGAVIRAHYGVPELVSLANDANHRYIHFEEEVGLSCGFNRCGYMVLVDESDMETLAANVAMHRDMGVNVTLTTADDAVALAPSLSTDDIALCAYEPDGGFASPTQTVAAYTTRATELGARFYYGQQVTNAQPEADGWRLTLSGGDAVSAAQVVLCTGNWSTPIGQLFGIDLPVRPVRVQIVVLERPNSMIGPMPVVSDLVRLAYYRTDGDTDLWVGSSDMADLQEFVTSPDSYDESVSDEAVENAREKSGHRFVPMASMKAPVTRSFVGLYETTPDWQPIIDSTFLNLHVAVGFSGHGFKLAPVVGSVIADAVSDLTPRPEVTAFRLSRFAEGKPIKSLHQYHKARFLR